MKTNVNYLPSNKQKELADIVRTIREIFIPEMIVLFGSYARDKWIEDKYDEDHYRYQSDFDILVIVNTRSESAQAKLERDIEDKIEKNEDIKTPVSVIVHDIDFVNRRLSKAQFFFTDIKKEGVLLYDSGQFQLKEAKELSPSERKKFAREDFDYWFSSASRLLETFQIKLLKKYYADAAFELHQAVERLYSGILLVFTRYKPNTHDLAILRKLANSVDYRLTHIFQLDNTESKRLFKLLKKAYVEARYKPNYLITHEELVQLYQQVEELKKLGELICQEKIDSFV
ncbi:MAG TPA: HEPN domain-containing protein [Gammaproteobacteria bacterium]|nr:HEPN domain-containing protein [Gammaproteobacteria bacterium]